jgi:peptidoglycan L-alanyl-D-glutamate endopeptidase CwlK
MISSHGLPRKIVDYFESNPREILTMGDCAAKFGVTQQAVHRAAKILEKEGLAELVDTVGRHLKARNVGSKRMAVTLSEKSEERLEGVHPDLVRVVRRCATDFAAPIDFMVLEGVRSREKQLKYVKSGASQTMDSRHRTGHAVDLAALVGGEARWDWPLYHTIAREMKAAAAEEKVEVEWGGDWANFPDGPHFQLSREKYPAPKQT